MARESAKTGNDLKTVLTKQDYLERNNKIASN